jgi:hypothetical protein
MDNPLSGLTWLYTRKGRAGSPDDLLRRLGRGEIELTHETFNGLQPWRAAAHLRELLMACGVLPAVDKQVCSLERWLPGHLASITDDDHAQIIRRFATWEVLPRLRARAEKSPVTPAARRHVGDQVKRATAFLQWLSGCHNATPVPICSSSACTYRLSSSGLGKKAGGVGDVGCRTLFNGPRKASRRLMLLRA